MFISSQSWTSLQTYISKWEQPETGLIYSALVSFMLISKTRNIISPEMNQRICDYLIKFCDNPSIFIDMDSLSIFDDKSLSLFSEDILLSLAETASRGHVLPGLLLLVVLNAAFRAAKLCAHIVKFGGFSSLQLVCISKHTHETVRSRAKAVMLFAMQSSPYVREKLLDNLIDVAKDTSSMCHPIYMRDPRDIYILNRLKNKKGGRKTGEDDEEDDDEDVYDDDDDDEVDEEVYASLHGEYLNLSPEGEMLDEDVQKDVEWR